jgi:predicted enzyme related to lactoylglutathione lyase
MVSLYVEVDDVGAYASRATELGGKVVMPPQKLPDGDEMAIILDVEGIPVGIFKPAAV